MLGSSIRVFVKSDVGWMVQDIRVLSLHGARGLVLTTSQLLTVHCKAKPSLAGTCRRTGP